MYYTVLLYVLYRNIITYVKLALLEHTFDIHLYQPAFSVLSNPTFNFLLIVFYEHYKFIKSEPRS